MGDDGYPLKNFAGWDDGSGNISQIVTINSGSLDDRTYTAVWVDNTDSYSIDYKLNGGALDQGKSNPTSYTRQTETFTLNTPSKAGYNFIGWSGTNLIGDLNVVVSVAQGSAGPRSYEAHYETIPYTINYAGLTEDELTALNNPTGFNVESETFTLNNPESRVDSQGNKTEDFAGWDDGDGNVSTLVTINTGSLDDRTYTAIWVQNTDNYVINYYLNDGSLSDPNPVSYNRNTETFTLNNPSKIGYNFIGWTGTGLNEPTLEVTIPKGSAGVRSYTANYVTIPYTIGYAGLTEEELTALNNPTGFNIETNTFTLNNPETRMGNDGYPLENFVGWDDENGHISNLVTIAKGSLDSRTYTATWEIDNTSYSINYNLNDGTVTGTNPTSYTRSSNNITLINPTKTGYNFTGWTGTGLNEPTLEVTIPAGSAGPRTYTANFETIPYSISYAGLTAEEEASLNNPTGFNVETNTFTLNNPETRMGNDGYPLENFVGWDDGNGHVSSIVTITTGSLDNRTYTAIWATDSTIYSIDYNLNDGTVSGTNPSSYTRSSNDITLINPTKEGYNFIGWTGTGLNEPTVDVTIPAGSAGNRVYTANFTAIPYTIGYAGLTEDELTTLNNPTGFNVETNTFTLNNPETRMGNDGYPLENFAGWDDGNGHISNLVTITTGSQGSRTYTATWEIDNTIYSIDYVLNDGTVSGTNPTSYTRASNDITLINPSKTGYNFIGWTGTGLNEATLEVTIPAGSAGNREYTANYSVKSYTITYGGLTEEEITALANPTSYDVETETFTLNNPSRNGYRFLGWDDGHGTTTTTVTISKGSTGNKSYTATWEVNEESYSITYNLDGGSVSSPNPLTYTVTTETFTLNNPTKEGYNFTGWSGTDIDGLSMLVTIPKGSTGNRTYTANYEVAPFTITYNGLTENELSELNNPTSYTSESETFTLNNPTREGYEFIGWSGTDIEFKSYTVTFDYQDGRDDTTATFRETSTPNGWLVNGDHYDDNSVITLARDIIITRDYLAGAETITLPTPTREKYIFNSWNSEPDGTGITYNNTSINNLDEDTRVYAIWDHEDIILSFDVKGGVALSPITVPYNTEVGDLPRTTKAGYLLEGWYLDEEYQNKVTNTSKFTDDTLLYANWEEDLFPYVYPLQEENFVCTGSTYIDTGIKLYTDTDNAYQKDYEAGFTIEAYVPSQQVQQAVFFNAKYEKSSEKWPGLVFRRENTGNNFEITQTINNGTKATQSITGWTLPYQVTIYRINHIVYYSVNGGEKIPLQDMSSFNQYFDINAYFCAGDNGSGGRQRYLKGTISNYYIRFGTYSDKDTETYLKPDGTVETYLTSRTQINNNNNNNSGNNSSNENNNQETPNENPNNNEEPNNQNQTPTQNSNSQIVVVTDADGNITIHNVGEEYNLGTNNTPGAGRELVVTVPTGSSGNRTYTANFEIKSYNVTYMNGDEKFYEEEIYYNHLAQGTSDVPTSPHKVFTGWYLNDTLFDFENTPITGDITLTSGFETVEVPTITSNPDTWTNDSVTLTISSNHDDYTYMYKIGNGDYMTYTNPFTVQENTTVYAYSVKDGITSLETVKVVDNIDKNSPVINSMDFNDVIPTSAYLDLRMIDEQSGLDRFKVYVDNVLVYESLSYEYDLNEEKVDSYLIDNLTRLSTYIVKVEVFDKAGNMSTMQKTLETPLGHAVARTLNYQGDEIEQYTSLYEAITSDVCTSSCHIQMLDDVTERNIIDQDQNILLDLNGKTITGSTTYAFTNNGTLTIVDYEEDNIGQVLSGGNAIINNGILQIGEIEDELVVSTTEPVIGGSAHGIDNYGTLKFYDGILMGTQAVHGTIDDTPYLYNANIIDQQGSIQIARLDKVVDAVARINSMYYTEAQNAIDSAKNGHIEDVEHNDSIIEQFIPDGKFHLKYDETLGAIVSNNQTDVIGTQHGYIKLDLTNYTNDQMLTVNAQINSEYEGYIRVTESPEDVYSSNYLLNITGEVPATDYKTILEKGKTYYIHIYYNKYSNDNSDSPKFKINSITLGNPDYTEFSNIDNVIMYNENRYYFEKQEDGTYVNNNLGVRSTSAHSYFVVDMTNENEDKVICITAKVPTVSGVYSYVILNDSPTLPSGSSGGQTGIKKGDITTYYITLNKNQVNYIHFRQVLSYAAANPENEKFTILSIGTMEPTNVDISDYTVYKNSSDIYYFARQPDGSIVNNNVGVSGYTAHSFLSFNLSEFPYDAYLNLTATVDSESGFDYGFITVNNSSSTVLYDNTSGRIALMSGSESNTYNIKLEKGRTTYVHFGYRKDGSVDSGTDTFVISNISLDTHISDPTVPLPTLDYLTNVTDENSWIENQPVLNTNPDTVQLLKNVALTQSLNVVNTRDVILDLNGKTLSSSAGDYVINNEGSLKIIDSEFENKANINAEYKLEQAALYNQAKQAYLADKAEYDEYAGLCDGCEPSQEYIVDQTLTREFTYTGEEETFEALQAGDYKLEVWGAQGGSTNSSSTVSLEGGYGGYSTGEISLNQNDILYINVGGRGESSVSGVTKTTAGGYNGGGNGANGRSSSGTSTGGGGGATHIATTHGELSELKDDTSSIILVAGGGGGSHSDTDNNGYNSRGGNGGGFIGTHAFQIQGSCSSSCTSYNYPSGGTQLSGGLGVTNWSSGATSSTTYAGTFGKGASGASSYGGGGGGYYGGGSGVYTGAGGGSGYIGNSQLTNKKMVIYSDDNSFASGDEDTKTVLTNNVSAIATSEYAKKEDGYAKITLILTEEEYEEMTSNIPKRYNVKTKPVFADYLDGIDFDSSIDIASLDVDSEVSYNNLVSEDLTGTIYSSSNSVIMNNEGAYLDITDGNVTLDVSNKSAIVNAGRLTLGENAYIKTTKYYSKGIHNTVTGDILDGSGTITTTSSDSYCIYNESKVDSNIKGYTLVPSQNSLGFENLAKIDLTLDSIKTDGVGPGIYHETNSDLIINNSTINSKRDYALSTENDDAVGIITINNSNILSMMYNNGKTININNSNMTSCEYNTSVGYLENIINNSGTINLKDTEIVNIGFHNYQDVKSIINSATLNIDGGSIIQNANTNYSYGIYNNGSGTVNIKGDFEITNGKRGIHNLGSLTLGDNSNAVSDSYPLINGETLTVYSQPGAIFNFYDGKLVGPNNKALEGTIADIPVAHELNVDKTNNQEIITLKSFSDMDTNEDYVAEIGNNKFVSIQAAIDSISDPTDATTVNLLKDVYTANNTIIPENYNVILNQKNHFIRSYNPICFTNNGIFELKDDSNSIDSNNTIMGKFIENNGTASYSNVTTNSVANEMILVNNEDSTLIINSGSITGQEKLAVNSGTLNINGGTFRLTGTSSNQIMFDNKATGSIITTSGTFADANGKTFKNSGYAELSNLTVNLSASTASFGIFLSNTGTAKIIGGTYGQTNRSGVLLDNSGTVEVKNVTSSLKGIGFNTGSLSIDGGTYTTSSNGYTTATYYRSGLSMTGTLLNISNATIIDDDKYAVYINTTGTVNIENSTIKSPASAVYVCNSATVNVISGSIESSGEYGIQLYSSSPVLNIGVEGGVPSKVNPSIKGSSYGLYNNTSTSTVNFYDGVLIGPTALYGSISSLESGYDVVTDNQNNLEYKYLDQLPVARNKRTGVEYYSIQDAIDVAENNDVIELMRNYTALTNAPSILIDEGQIITFDLMSYKIDHSNVNLFTNDGTFTIRSTGGEGLIVSSANNICNNNGVLNIESGTYRNSLENLLFTNNTGATTNITGGSFFGIEAIINNDGTMNISNATIKHSRASRTLAIKNNADATLIMTSVEILNGGYYSTIINEGYLEVNNSVVDLNRYDGCSYCSGPPTTFIENKSTGTATVSGGLYGKSVTKGKVINNAGVAQLINVDSDLTSATLNTGTLTVTGVTYSNASIESSAGTLNVTGSTITDSGSDTIIITGGLANIENSTITEKQTNHYAVKISGSSTTNLKSGTFISEKASSVYIAGSPIVNIGVEGGVPSKVDPSLTGKTYGLYNSSSTSTVNFYDGVIIGNAAIYGSTHDLEDNYEIISEMVEGVEHKYLDIAPLVENARTHDEYYTIQEAIDEAADGDTINLIRQYTATISTSAVTIPSNKSIIFDLMEYKIVQNNALLFTNNGTLTVKSTGGAGIIELNSDDMFINNGILNIESGTYRCAHKKSILTNNEGATFKMSGGIISGDSEVITNDGTFNMSGGKITRYTDSRAFSIMNGSTGSITITGGEIYNAGEDAAIINEGDLDISDITVNLAQYESCQYCFGWTSHFIENKVGATASITGGTYGLTKSSGVLILNYGTAEISNITDRFSSSYNEGNLTISNVILKNSISNYTNGVLNITGDVTSSSSDYLIAASPRSTTNVISGTVKSDNNYAIYMDNYYNNGDIVLNIGTPGGLPSTTDPIIQGKYYAIGRANNNTNTKIYFYDGVLIGETAPVSGTIYDYEPGYKEDWNNVTDPDTGITTVQSTLTLIGPEVRNVIVGNLNFISLQSAVNYAVSSNIADLYLNNSITLTDDLVKPDGIEVYVHLNGFTINQLAYTIDSGIHLVDDNNQSNNLGASVLGYNVNYENIVIYMLNDGSTLENDKVYRLYKLNNGDYEIVNISENRIGNYDIGRGTTEMYTVNGKIYINDVSEGTYKLTSSDGNSIDFEVLSDGVSSNIKINNKVIKNRIVEAVAELIIQIQTGTARLPIILFIVIMTLLVSIFGLMTIKKHKRV